MEVEQPQSQSIIENGLLAKLATAVATQPWSTIYQLSCAGHLLAKSGYFQTSRKSPNGRSPIIVAEQVSGSEKSSTIDQDVQQALQEFDAEYI